MNIRKVLTTKILPLFLVLTLVFFFSVSDSFATVMGSESDPDSIIDSIGNISGANTLKSVLDSASLGKGYTYITMMRVDERPVGNCYVAFVTSNGPLRVFSNRFYIDDPSTDIYWCQAGTYLSVPNYLTDTSSASYSHGDYYEVSNNSRFNFGFYLGANAEVWANYDFYIDDYLAASYNLDASSYLPDTRYLSVDSTSFNGSDYLSVVTNDPNFDNLDTYVTFTGVHNNDSFTYTFYRSQFIDVAADNPYVYFYLNPYSIFSDYFTLNSATYENTTGSYGSKTIPLTLSFGNPPISYNPINEYYWSSTSVTEYNGGSAWGFDYIKVDTVDGDFWDDNKVLIQPFSFSVMAIPIMPSGITSMDYYVELVNDYLSYYDVILTEVPETTFDNLYGAGSFSDFQNSVSWVHYGNFLMDVSEWYSAHELIAHPLDYEYYDNLPIYSSSQTCGIAFSDHFYYKQLSYMLGDTSDILTEFSSRFYEEDGFTDWLSSSLTSIYDGQYDFFFDTLGYLRNFNYFVNDLTLNKYIPDSVDLLKDIKELLGDILNDLGENAPIDINDLESPLLDIYQFIDALYQGSKTKVSDLRLTLKAVSSGILPDGNGGEIYLLPTGTPSPVPLPTVPVLPALP